MLFKNKLIKKLENSGVKIAVVINKNICAQIFSDEYQDTLESEQFSYNEDASIIDSFQEQFIVVEDAGKIVEIGNKSYENIKNDDNKQVSVKNIDFNNLQTVDLKYFDSLYNDYQNYKFDIERKMIRELCNEEVVIANFFSHRPNYNIEMSQYYLGLPKGHDSVLAICKDGFKVIPLYDYFGIEQDKVYDVYHYDIQIKHIDYDDLNSDLLEYVYNNLKAYKNRKIQQQQNSKQKVR